MDENEFEFEGKILFAKRQFDCNGCYFHTNEKPFCTANKITVPNCYDFKNAVIFMEKQQ